MATNKQIAENVLKAVGGKENVVNLAHCFTRLRFTLKDESKVDQDALRKTQGVIQLIMADNVRSLSAARWMLCMI